MALLILHYIARLFGIDLSYAIRFIPANAKRTDLRGRTVYIIDKPGLALATLKSLRADESLRKETTYGTYYLAIEAQAHHFFHEGQQADTKPEDGAVDGGLFAGLPQAPDAGPEAANPQKTDDASAEGTAGGGGVDQRPAWPDPAAGTEQPVEEVSQPKVPLDKIGLR